MHRPYCQPLRSCAAPPASGAGGVQGTATHTVASCRGLMHNLTQAYLSGTTPAVYGRREAAIRQQRPMTSNTRAARPLDMLHYWPLKRLCVAGFQSLRRKLQEGHTCGLFCIRLSVYCHSRLFCDSQLHSEAPKPPVGAVCLGTAATSVTWS